MDHIIAPLNEALDLAFKNCFLQVNGVDVSIPFFDATPGAGKTAAITNLAKIQNCGFLSTHFASKPIEENGGIPNTVTFMYKEQEYKYAEWTIPQTIKTLYELSEEYEKKGTFVIWLLDDSHLMGPSHMTLMYELLTERKLRDYKLPKNVAIFMAGNHGSSKAGAKTQWSAIVARIFFMKTFASFENWKKNFAIQNGVHPAMISYLENDNYSKFFHEEEQVDIPWACPRQWTRLSNMIINIENWEKKPLTEDKLLYIANGHVGKEAASSFVAYYSIYCKFDIPNILLQGKNYILPSSTVDRYAFAHALTSYYIGSSEKKKIVQSYCEIIYKYLKEYKDLGLMIIHDIIDAEKILNKRNMYQEISSILNTIEPGITRMLLNAASNV